MYRRALGEAETKKRRSPVPILRPLLADLRRWERHGALYVIEVCGQGVSIRRGPQARRGPASDQPSSAMGGVRAAGSAASRRREHGRRRARPLGVDVVELGGADERIRHRRPLAAAIGAREQPASAAGVRTAALLKPGIPGAARLGGMKRCRRSAGGPSPISGGGRGDRTCPAGGRRGRPRRLPRGRKGWQATRCAFPQL